MPVYVDSLRQYVSSEFSNPAARKYGNFWCHMTADTLVELHAMADLIGLQRRWFQYQGVSTPHYDLNPIKRQLALKHGAIEHSIQDRIAMRRKGVFKQQFIELGIVS